MNDVIAKSDNIGTGRRCFPFHLWNVELVLLIRDALNIGGTTAVNHCDLGCDFLTNPSSRLAIDDSLSPDIAET